jgi:5'-nucleotidase
MLNRWTRILLTLAAAGCVSSPTAVSYGHSLEADSREDLRDAHELEDNIELRLRAAQRLHWRIHEQNRDPLIHIKLLGLNDFHGQLSAKTVGARPAGGAAVLASYLKSAAASAEDGSLIIHAGDQVGASPPNSALLQDEPAISLLNMLANDHCNERRVTNAGLPSWLTAYAQPFCNVVGTLGNHEFDEGIQELSRLLDGGNSPKGPFLEIPWKGARFPYVSANVEWRSNGAPVLPPYTVQIVKGIRIGVIGAVLKDTPTIVTPTGVAGVQFLDEATSINRYARELRQQGVHTIIVTIHQGTSQASYTGQTDPAVQNLQGPIIDIIKQLDDDIDVVISGHTHQFTNALVPNAHGKEILVTQAFSASTAYDDIDLSISRKSGDVIEKSAAIVTTWGDAGPGLSPDTQVAKLVAAADQRVAPLVTRIIGVSTNALTRAENATGESTLGNLIADAQRTVTHAQFAFMNPGGIRADLDSGEVSWGDLFTIQPFANDLVSMDLTGQQIALLLEQQWVGQGSAPKLLKTSGLRYTWDAARPIGSRVVQILDGDGNALDPTHSYRVTVNSFMAAGGDNFVVLSSGVNRVIGPVDLDALVTYVQGLAQPFSVAIEARITRLN